MTPRIPGDIQLALAFIAGAVLVLIGMGMAWGWAGLLMGGGAGVCAATVWVGR